MLNFSKVKIFFITLISLVALIFAIPSFVTAGKLPTFLANQRVNLGLDLRGGAHLLLKVDFDYYLHEQLNNLKEEIKFNFKEQLVRALPVIEGNSIVFQLQTDHEKASKIIRKISNEINLSENNNKFEITFSDQKIVTFRQNLIKQSIEIIRRRVDESGTKEPIIQAQGNDRILLQVAGIEDPKEIKSILGKTAKMTFHFVDDETFGTFNQLKNIINSDLEEVADEKGRVYLIKKEVVLSGDLLIDANPTYHQGLPAVAFRFNDLGARKFAQITKNNIGKFFAIILDGKVVTAPRINTVINEGMGVISGSFTTKEAAEVALLLRAGALPAPLTIIEERTVGPSLGLDSIKAGATASIVGLIMVAIFMVVFYGFFGLIANLTMIVNVAIIVSILSLINATLTLPGIAGIILTMGMSVDANVLIYERIKEELRDKKTILASLEQGFSQAFRTILDSNITTLIVALFLYIFGTGSVKGFAVTLSIGIVSSMFSAILLTRMIIAIWIKKTRPKGLGLI
jgi:preprotein translocase subunit SecD